MSIDARVFAVCHDGGKGGPPGYLSLMDRPARPGQVPGIAGQKTLYFDVTPPWIDELIGKDIWGGGNDIMYKQQEIARREGYTRIVFTAKTLHGLGPTAAREQGLE